MEHVSPEYQRQLSDLAKLLCPIKEVVEINPLSIPREDEIDYDEIVNRWSDMGEYLDRE